MTIPSSNTLKRDAAVDADISKPYCSTVSPFSREKGSISENDPDIKRFKMIIDGMSILRQGSEKMVLNAVLQSLRMPFTVTASPCLERRGIEMKTSEMAE